MPAQDVHPPIPARVEIAAEAMWSLRARSQDLTWQQMSWEQFALERPDIALIYRDNASVVLLALEGASA